MNLYERFLQTDDAILIKNRYKEIIINRKEEINNILKNEHSKLFYIDILQDVLETIINDMNKQLINGFEYWLLKKD